MRGVIALQSEDPFLANMRGVLFAFLMSDLPSCRMGSWRVVQKSGEGLLIISCAGRARWRLQWSGEIKRDALSCLKAALAEAAREKQFQGGRGSPGFRHTNGYAYDNKWGHPNDEPAMENKNFLAGRETIHNEKGELRGWGRYQAMLL